MSSDADLLLAYTPLHNALIATFDLAELGANGSSSVDGVSPYKDNPILPTQYLTNVENWMFGDTDTANTVKGEFIL